MSAAMERPGQTRERAKSTFSLKSDKSRNSSHKHERHPSESAEEKRRTHLTATTKANPNAAMNEAQPSMLHNSNAFVHLGSSPC
jgi:hypothetical protein